MFPSQFTYRRRRSTSIIQLPNICTGNFIRKWRWQQTIVDENCFRFNMQCNQSAPNAPININSCIKTNNDEAKRWRINVELNLDYTPMLHAPRFLFNAPCCCSLMQQHIFQIIPKRNVIFVCHRKREQMKFVFWKKKSKSKWTNVVNVCMNSWSYRVNRISCIIHVTKSRILLPFCSSLFFNLNTPTKLTMRKSKRNKQQERALSVPSFQSIRWHFIAFSLVFFLFYYFQFFFFPVCIWHLVVALVDDERLTLCALSYYYIIIYRVRVDSLFFLCS